MGKPVILSYGMGRDSTAIILRWLLDPSSRDFSLDDLTVVTAQVGNEWSETYGLVDAYVLPLMRMHGVRYVQLCRTGPGLADGFTVLDDSREPATVRHQVPWSLRDELLKNGTVPESAAGRRKCSIKYKGAPIDAWIKGELKGRAYRHIIGFNSDELNRVARDGCYGGENRTAEYPLVQWGMGHDAVAAYCREAAGVEWAKSACHFCPFSRGKEEVRDRMLREPEKGVDTLFVEHVAMAFNSNMLLYASQSAYDALAADSRLDGIRKAFKAKLRASQWSMYRVRRVMVDGVWDRAVEVLYTGEYADVEDALFDRADELGGKLDTDRYGISRLLLRGRDGDKKEVAALVREAKAARKLRAKGTPAPEASVAQVEEFLVMAPAVVAAKARSRFDKQWRLALTVLEACPA